MAPRRPRSRVEVVDDTILTATDPAAGEGSPAHPLARGLSDTGLTLSPGEPMAASKMPELWSVEELGRRLATALSRAFPGSVRVCGEIAEMKDWSGGGHRFISLREAGKPSQSVSRVECVVWAGQLRKWITERAPAADIGEGEVVEVTGKLGIWDKASQYRLVITDMVRTGEGQLKAHIEKLRAWLISKGFVDPETLKKVHPRPLPALPLCVGIVTGQGSQAEQDMLSQLRKRMPHARVIMSYAIVQGQAAKNSISEAISALEAVPEVEVIVLARGGGALAELMPFNTTEVTMKVLRCAKPIVSAIGHAGNHSMTDEVADVAAITPTQAIQLLYPKTRDQLRDELGQQAARLKGLVRGAVDRAHRRLLSADAALQAASPERKLREWRGRLDAAERGMRAATAARLAVALKRLSDAERRRERFPWDRRFHDFRSRWNYMQQRLEGGIWEAIGGRFRRLDIVEGRLQALSPLAVLQRGFAIVKDAATGRAVRDAAEVTMGAPLHITLARGALIAEAVEAVVEPDETRPQPRTTESTSRH